MSKEDVVAGEDARHWEYGVLSGAPGEATPIGIEGDAILQLTAGMTEEVMPN